MIFKYRSVKYIKYFFGNFSHIALKAWGNLLTQKKGRPQVMVALNPSQVESSVAIISGILPLHLVKLKVIIRKDQVTLRNFDNKNYSAQNNIFFKSFTIVKNEYSFLWECLTSTFIIETNSSILEKIFFFKVIRMTLTSNDNDTISRGRDLSWLVLRNEQKKLLRKQYLENYKNLQAQMKPRSTAILVAGGNTAKYLLGDIRSDKFDEDSIAFFTSNDHTRVNGIDKLGLSVPTVYCLDDPVIGMGNSTYFVDFISHIIESTAIRPCFIVCRESIASTLSFNPELKKIIIGLKLEGLDGFIRLDERLVVSTKPSHNSFTRITGIVAASNFSQLLLYGADGASQTSQNAKDIKFPEHRRSAYQLHNVAPPKIYSTLAQAQEQSERYDFFMAKFIEFVEENGGSVKVGRASFLPSLHGRH